MLITFLVYLASVFDVIQKLAFIFLIIGVSVFVVFLAIYLFEYFSTNYKDEIVNSINKKYIKYVSIFFIVLSLIVVFVPKSETMYLMIGAYLGSKVIENPEVNENLSKVYKIITYKLDEALDEYEQNLKENTSKSLSR